jgi:hypothetical protein
MAVDYYSQQPTYYSPYVNQGNINPFANAGQAYSVGSGGGAGGGPLSNTSGSAAPGAGGNTDWAWQGLMPPTMEYPQGQLQYLKSGTQATDYPQYMRSLGENMAQRSFQQASGNVVAGRAPQQIGAAQDAMNLSRLGYMSGAGQEAFKVAQGQETAQLSLYEQYLKQRQQYMDWMLGMRGAAAQETSAATKAAGEGGTGVNINPLGGGGSSGLPSYPYQVGKPGYTTPTQGTYRALGGF